MNNQNPNSKNPNGQRPIWNVENYEDRVKDFRSECRRRNENPTEENWMQRVRENVSDAWEDTKDAASEAWENTRNWVDDTWQSVANKDENKNPNY